jgi:hypothetical protein
MATAAYNATISVTSQPSIAFTYSAPPDGATSTSDQLTYSITDTTKRFFDRDVAPVIQARYDEQQSITITGTPTGGTFVLAFGGQNTTALNWNCSAADMQTALQALSSIGANNALVTGGPGPGTAFTVEFTGTMGYASQALITLHTNSLTGGSSPSVAIARVKAGSTWTTITTGFTLYKIYARVVFAVAQAATTQVRFYRFNYYVIASLANAKTAEFAGKVATDDVTTFNTSGEESSIVTTRSGTLKLGTVKIDQTRAKSLQARDLLVLEFSIAGDDYAGYYYASDLDLKADPKKAITEDLTLLLTDEFYSA